MLKPKPAQDEKGRFLPRNNCGNGRPKGSRNQLGEAFIADLYEHWQIHGMAAIKTVCDKHPADYLRVIASILPRDSNVKVSAVESMTDDELDAQIAKLLLPLGYIKNDADGEGPPSTEH